VPTEALRQRVALGLRLYRAGAAPLLVLSGGGKGPVAEAQAMRELALADGAPPAALLLEPRSRDTLENALYTARLLHARLANNRLSNDRLLNHSGQARVVLVSDRPHLPRAALLFRLAGLSVTGRAGVPAPPRSVPARILYELAAFPWSLARALLRRH